MFPLVKVTDWLVVIFFFALEKKNSKSVRTVESGFRT